MSKSSGHRHRTSFRASFGWPKNCEPNEFVARVCIASRSRGEGGKRRNWRGRDRGWSRNQGGGGGGGDRASESLTTWAQESPNHLGVAERV